MDPLNQIASVVLPIILVLVSLLLAVEVVAWTGWRVKKWRLRRRSH